MLVLILHVPYGIFDSINKQDIMIKSILVLPVE